jgi:hypothetical protein
VKAGNSFKKNPLKIISSDFFILNFEKMLTFYGAGFGIN